MNHIIIDVREPDEYASGHVAGAINIPPSMLLQGIPDQLKNVPTNTRLILYCRSGARSNVSMRILEQYGFTNLVNGINADHVTAKHLA